MKRSWPGVTIMVWLAFPGLLGRGLIEARPAQGNGPNACPPFPGLLGRGLIEARVPLRRPRPAGDPLSPVY